MTGQDFKKCVHCPDRDYCSTCMCRNYNETGDMFKPAEHFCKVAAINHEVVDEKQRQMIERSEQISDEIDVLDLKGELEIGLDD